MPSQFTQLIFFSKTNVMTTQLRYTKLSRYIHTCVKYLEVEGVFGSIDAILCNIVDASIINVL